MESKLYLEDDHNLNMSEDGGGAIEVLDTETTRVDVNSPQVRACTDMNATAKAIMSGAPSASGHPLDQGMFTLMMNMFRQTQEQAEQKHVQMLEQARQMKGLVPEETLQLQEQTLQTLEQTLQRNAQSLHMLEQTWIQQQPQLAQEQTMSLSEDTQHTPEHPGSGEIQLNEQLVKTTSLSKDAQHVPEQSGSGEIRLNEQLVQVVPSAEGRPQEAPRIARQLHEVPQKEERPDEAPQEEGQPPEGPRVKLRPSKDPHVRDQHPEVPKAGTPSHLEQQAQEPPNTALQVKEWPPEVPPARDQLLGRRNWEVKVNCWEDLGGQPTQTKDKVKKKEEEGRWSWHRNCPKTPYFKQNWRNLPKKCLKARFRTSHEGQSVCCQSTGKRTKWKMRNAQKQFFLFVQSLFISFC